MKQKLTMLLGLALILGLAVSCKAALGTPTMGNKPKVLKPGEVPIQIRLGHLDKDGKPVDGFPSYRAVVPKEWDDTLKGNLTFEITGTDPSNASITPIKNITWDSIKGGTASIILSKTGIYKLTMKAYKKGTSPLQLVLESKETSIDIGTAPVAAFVLYPVRDAAAPEGEIKLKIKFSNPARYGAGNNERLIKQLKVEIKGKTHAQTISKNFGATFTEPLQDVPSSDSTTGGEQLVSINESAVKPDIYEVSIKAFKEKNDPTPGTYEQIGGLFNEIIIVDPLNTSEGFIELPTNLEDKPTAPANFKATYKIAAQSDYLKSPDGGTTYSAEFTWDKTSINTEWFEIVLTPTDSPTTPIIKGKGLIGSSDTSFTVTGLELGKKYTVGIRAYNKYGPSPETPYEDPKNAVAGATDLDTGKYGYLHLQKVVYHLQDGAFIIPAEGKNAVKMNTTDNGSDGQCTDYYTFRNAGFEFQLPGTTGMPRIGRYNTATNQMWTFKGFYKDTDFNTTTLSPNSSSVAAVTCIPNNELDSVKYYAYWVLDTNVSVTFPSYESHFNIPNSNSPIVCPSSGTFTKLRINFAGAISDLDVKWTIPGYSVTDTPETGSYSEFEVKPADINNSAGSGNLSQAKGLHQVLVTFKYKIGGIEKEGSTFCYINVTD